MIGLEDRQSLSRDIGVAHSASARLKLACEIAGIVGITTTLATAASATSTRLSATPAKTTRSWPRVARSKPRSVSETRRAGHATRATGRPSAP